MRLQRILENLSDLALSGVIPKGVIDEGRIFSFGAFENEDNLHGRVKDVVEGLKDHVGQPFDGHTWAFTFDLSTFKHDSVRTPISFAAVVRPLDKKSALVWEFIVTPRRLVPKCQLIFHHSPDGTTATVPSVVGDVAEAEELIATSLYPLAIAVVNTRGCTFDFKRAPVVENARRKRQGKPIMPGRYDVDTSEYVSALRSSVRSSDAGGTHASPLPHLRRAHERVLASGERIWVRSALVNVRAEGDIAFVERRSAYQRKGHVPPSIG